MTPAADQQPAGTAAPELAELIESAVLSVPAVAALDRGQFGTVMTYLPGKRVVGVQAGTPGEPVRLSVVLYLGIPVQEAVAELRAVVRVIAGDVPVDITVSDLIVPGEQNTNEPDGPRRTNNG
jgi:hypothetical protein